MGKIRLTPAELLAQSREMTELKRQYEELFQGIDAVLSETNRDWSENLANNFAGKLSAAQSGFSKVTELLQAGALIAGRSASAYQSADSQLAQIFGGQETVNGGREAAGVLEARIRSFLEQAGESAPESRESLGELLDKIETWRESPEGKMDEAAYDLLDKLLGKESVLGEVKDGYEVVSDILRGDIGWDTAKSFTGVIGWKSSKVGAVIETGKLLFSEDSYYVQRSQELNEQMAEHLREGDLLGTTFLMAGSFVDLVGKGVVETGSNLIADILHLDTVNTLIEEVTGADIGAGIEKGAQIVGDGISDFIDTGAEVLGGVSEKIGEAGASAIEFVGDLFSDAEDALGKLFG